MYNRDFSRLYDRLMRDYDYEKWAAFVAEILRRYRIETGCGLDLACGSGKFSILLSGAYRMTGVDVSPEMLNLARDNAREKGLTIPFVRQDVRALSVPKPADFAVMLCDGVNYITDGLEGAFDRIRASLTPGGLFVFDISSAYKLTQIMGNNVFYREYDDVAYVWENEYDEKARLVYLDLTFFAREADGLYRKFQEEQTMRVYTEDEITDALTRSGFRVHEILGNIAPRTATSERLHFVASAREST